MSGELVLYDPARAGGKVPPRRSQFPSRRAVSLRFSEEVREQLDALLRDVRERHPEMAEFTDLLTGSLGALLIMQELRNMREAEERLYDELGW